MALSTRNSAFCVVVALAACLAQPAFAFDPRYPDWPCQQLKVPGISVASVWTGPSIEGHDKRTHRPQARRSGVASGRPPHPDGGCAKTDRGLCRRNQRRKAAKGQDLFAALYSTLNAQRDEVMNGIERFSRKQKAMAEEIRDETQKMRNSRTGRTPMRRSREPRRSDDVADPHFRGSPQIDVLCLRSASPYREAVVRSRQRDSNDLTRRRPAKK